jgi:hypothetical protein
MQKVEMFSPLIHGIHATGMYDFSAADNDLGNLLEIQLLELQETMELIVVDLFYQVAPDGTTNAVRANGSVYTTAWGYLGS